ncbi:MAG: hypothetical protein RBR42_05125 [Desulfomicrobium sp.]|nr:hypothetical protein [Desulfomicrobium sp.]
MAEHKPLVRIDGELKQLPDGDTLSILSGFMKDGRVTVSKNEPSGGNNGDVWIQLIVNEENEDG